jgi:hypothetical protein
MGVRVTFYLGAPGGLEGLFWGATPQSFLDWSQDMEREFPGTFSPEMLHRIGRMVAEGPTCLNPADRRDAELIDSIFDSFVGEYCDTSARSLLRCASDSTVYVRWYEEARTRIESRCSRQTLLCWDHLLDGRAVGRPTSPYPYTPSDVVFRLGYWTAEEVRIVHDDLRTAFPAAARRREQRSRGLSLPTPEDEVAVEIALEATAMALGERTNVITTVA